MRLNKFLAQASGLSRRAADATISNGEITVNRIPASLGQTVNHGDIVGYNGSNYPVSTIVERDFTSILLHKPAGYVVSRNGQGSQTVYELLPTAFKNLKPVGRLDKDSSGLLLLTDDGDLANRLTHPSFQKIKVYEVALNQPLQPLHHQMISDYGIQLDDGRSQLTLERLQDSHDDDGRRWRVTMREGRNRQIRRTFAALGYTVTRLHRTQFGDYSLGSLAAGKFQKIPPIPHN